MADGRTIVVLEENDGPIESKGTFQRVLTRFPDPLTLPESKIECSKTVDLPWGGSTCVEWRTYWRRKYLLPTLRAIWPDGGDIAKAVNECLDEPAIRVALAAVVAAAAVGGIPAAAGAAQTFKDMMLACVSKKLSNSVQIWLDWPSQWGGWE
jgi:hypothetical protein